MNELIINFMGKNWLAIIIFIFIIIIPVVPPELLAIRREDPVTKFRYFNFSILYFVISAILKPIQDLLIYITFRGAITLLIFLVIAVSIYFERKITQITAILAGLGI